LTDTNGRKTDFRNVIVVMTTNAGAQIMGRRSMGFTEQDHETDGMEEIKRLFTPEFRNRLDGIIQFKPLDERTITNVVDKFIIELEHQLEEKRVSMMIEDDARSWLARKGYDPKMGARPMARVIQEHLKRPLADELLFGRLSKGGVVRVTLNTASDELEIEVMEKESATS
ncbi:MAG: AAA family ATPase, partial [Gammaproteobacteria bacterium]|nr:AAA family ATPase [Gammaproteobacteria bacterium]